MYPNNFCITNNNCVLRRCILLEIRRRYAYNGFKQLHD